MRLHSVRAAVLAVTGLLALFAFTPVVSGQEKAKDEARYRFTKGEVLKYEVTSNLSISMRGSHSAFLVNGNENPLSWTVNGLFENTVLDVNAADGAATLERKVRTVDSHGNWNDEKFKLSWNREKDKTAPEDGKYPGLMDKFIVGMIANPVQYGVDVEGKTSLQFSEMNRLVMRRGMMTWPLKDEASWVTVEEIAVPVLHDKIKVEFKNTVIQDATRTGFKVRVVRAPASLKGADKTPGFGYEGVTFTVAGQAQAEFDMTNGRLHKLEIDLTLRLSGKGPVPEGGDGDIKGVVTYKETQVYKD